RISASSSMTRILPLFCVVVGEAIISSGGYRLSCRTGDSHRKLHSERGATAPPVEDFNGSPMLLNDTVGDAQAETGTFLRALRGEERIVDAVQVFRSDPVAGIRHFDLRAGAIAV